MQKMSVAWQGKQRVISDSECNLYRNFLCGQATPMDSEEKSIKDSSRQNGLRSEAAAWRLLVDAVGVFLNDGVCEDLAGDAFDFGASGVGLDAIGEREHEILALAHGGDIGKSDLAESVVDGLA